MTEAFADTFYFIAILNPKDRLHQKSLRITKELRCRVVTTTWVLLEVADALSSPLLRQATHRFLLGLANSPDTVVLPATESGYRQGLQLYGKRPDKDWPLTDCINFEVMRERGITDALTGDHHFVQAGFRALLLEP